jgi:hypothetical protein
MICTPAATRGVEGDIEAIRGGRFEPPTGASVNSPGRQPWVQRDDHESILSPGGATEALRGESLPPPLWGSGEDPGSYPSVPGLGPWAID